MHYILHLNLLSSDSRKETGEPASTVPTVLHSAYTAVDSNLPARLSCQRSVGEPVAGERHSSEHSGKRVSTSPAPSQLHMAQASTPDSFGSTSRNQCQMPPNESRIPEDEASSAQAQVPTCGTGVAPVNLASQAMQNLFPANNEPNVTCGDFWRPPPTTEQHVPTTESQTFVSNKVLAIVPCRFCCSFFFSVLEDYISYIFLGGGTDANDWFLHPHSACGYIAPAPRNFERRLYQRIWYIWSESAASSDVVCRTRSQHSK